MTTRADLVSAPPLKLNDDGSVVITFEMDGPVYVLLPPAAAGSFFSAGMRLLKKHQERMKAKPLPGQRSIYDELD